MIENIVLLLILILVLCLLYTKFNLNKIFENFQSSTTTTTTRSPTITKINLNHAIIDKFPSSVRSPNQEQVARLIEPLSENTKYLIFEYNRLRTAPQENDKPGFIITLPEKYILNGFKLKTANDFVGRDPKSVRIYGIDNTTQPPNETQIYSFNDLELPNTRNTLSNLYNITNNNFYNIYKFVFPDSKSSFGSNSNPGKDELQISKIQLFGITRPLNTIKNNFYEKSNLMRDKINEIDNKYKNIIYKTKEFDTSFVDAIKNKFNMINDMRNASVDTNINYNNDVIKELNENISDLETSLEILPKVNNSLTGVRSLQNGMKMGVSLNNNKNYKVHINGGCLNDKGNLNYGVSACSNDKKTQEFDILNIPSDGFYNAILEPSLDKIKDSDNIDYPFLVIKSKNTDRCLQNNFGKISIQPCMVKKSQRWKKINNYKCT